MDNHNCEYCIKKTGLSSILIKREGIVYVCYLCTFCHNSFIEQINFCEHCRCIIVDDDEYIYHNKKNCFYYVRTRPFILQKNYFNN